MDFGGGGINLFDRSSGNVLVIRLFPAHIRQSAAIPPEFNCDVVKWD